MLIFQIEVYGPKKDVYKKEEVIQNVILYNLFTAITSPQAVQHILSMMRQLMKSKKIEISDKLLVQININSGIN